MFASKIAKGKQNRKTLQNCPDNSRFLDALGKYNLASNLRFKVLLLFRSIPGHLHPPPSNTHTQIHTHKYTHILMYVFKRLSFHTSTAIRERDRKLFHPSLRGWWHLCLSRPKKNATRHQSQSKQTMHLIKRRGKQCQGMPQLALSWDVLIKCFISGAHRATAVYYGNLSAMDPS